MKSANSTMSYLELLKLASPEAVVVVTALVVLVIGLATGRATSGGTVSTAQAQQTAADTAAATDRWSLIAALGLILAIGAVLQLPHNAALFGCSLLNTPLTSLFKIIYIGLAFFAVLLTKSDKSLRHPGKYLTILLLATVGLMLLDGSEELLIIFIEPELLGLSHYVMAAFDKA